MNKYVLGIGAANVDVYCKSEIDLKKHYDHPSKIYTSVGGVTRNILENLSLLGVNTKLITALGDDTFGKEILDSCKKCHIDTKDVLYVDNSTSGVFVQVLDENNDMHMAMCDMSLMKEITVSFLKNKSKVISKASAIILDPSLPFDSIEYLLNSYPNIPFFIDPVSDEYAKKIKPLIGKFFACKPNKTELEKLSNIKIKCNEDIIKACEKLKKQGLRKNYVSLGKDGCLFYGEKHFFRKFKTVKHMENASGAGDCFMSAIIYSYMNNLNDDETIDLALAAGISTILNKKVINDNLSIELLNKIIKENK